MKINNYLFIQLIKYFFLILFIFLSVAWILQLTRLFTITNFMHIEIIDVLMLSLYLIPNIITVIIPFIIIFGLLLCFIKLNKDNELIAILTLGIGLRPFKNTLLIFSVILVFIFSFLNFYLAPKIYEIYKFREYDLRNTLDLNNIGFSNFLNINKTTILDFTKINNRYYDILISFKNEEENKENIVYAKEGNIINKNNQYNFQLKDGFKISIDNQKQIEKLEFLDYILKVSVNNIHDKKILDKNTLTIFDDFNSENYLNIGFKIVDIILIIFIISLFYFNNLKKINFTNSNNVYFIIICVSVLIINQILKNSEIILLDYILIITSIIFITSLISFAKKRYEQN